MAAVMAEYATVGEAMSGPAGPSPLAAGAYHILDQMSSKRYKVKNVDDRGRIIHVGYLELTEQGVVFTFEHYPSESKLWALSCIRKYGVNAADGVFALEVGRRSSTGEGTFAFRTEEAEEISRTLDYLTSSNSSVNAGNLQAFSWRR